MVELGGPIQLSSPIASTSNIAAPSSSLGSSSNRTGPPTRPLPPREDELQAAKSNGQVTESELRQLDESRGAIVHVSLGSWVPPYKVGWTCEATLRSMQQIVGDEGWGERILRPDWV